MKTAIYACDVAARLPMDTEVMQDIASLCHALLLTSQLLID